MEDAVFWSALYVGAGALLGHFHLFRCARCAVKFEGPMDHVTYTLLSALFGIPILILWALLASVSACGPEEDE